MRSALAFLGYVGLVILVSLLLAGPPADALKLTQQPLTTVWPYPTLDLGTGTLMFGASPGAGDVMLLRDGVANNLAQRNGTAAQTFHIYNTFTSATNAEWGELDWTDTANVFRVGTEKGSGGGVARPMQLITDSLARMIVGTTGGISLGATATTTNDSEIAMNRMMSPATATGNNAGKLAFICGSTTKTLKLVAYVGTQTTANVVVDNLALGSTLCP